MAVAIARTANPAGAASVGGVTTYTAAATGTASIDRIIAVAIGKEVATSAVTAVTINSGGGAISMILANGNTFASQGAWIYFASVPTGTTADILVTWSAAVTGVQNNIAVYALTDAGAPPLSGNNTSTDMDVTVPLTSGSVTIPVGGGMLAVASCAADTVTKTWANLTADLDIDAGDFRMNTATSITAGTAARTCTGGTNAEDGVLAWAIFSQQKIPDLNIQPLRQPPR